MIVVAAALLRADGRVLMQQRRIGSFHGGLWEFPGGKVETGESPEYALSRELEEELGIAIAPDKFEPAGFASDLGSPESSGRPLVILFYTCRDWSGEPHCLQGEAIDWLALNELESLAMPPLDIVLTGQLQKLFCKAAI